MTGRSSLALLLSFLGGYADTLGFLALQGLFTAHVTGNFVTLAASLVLGTSGVLPKILALPTFFVVVLAARIVGRALAGRAPVLRVILGIEALLLGAAAILAARLGPFDDGDAWPAIVTGLTLVAAMAIQNALHRVHLSPLPPSTVMTTTATQIMLDLAELLLASEPDDAARLRARLAPMIATATAFVLGCAATAAFFAFDRTWCFAAPPLLGLAALVHPGAAPQPEAR